ncbi:Hypothetical predicted protein [Pelobates cultripes]|uniref:Uncharacterized protein n=1 Tax=Pelobates cultripes TaxID=61616 RepID=A0AAD1T4G5_PELCU|nr:Hypothetical predicted protein [Pelobates cultripes]
MDGFVNPSTGPHHEAAGTNMVASPTHSLSSEAGRPSLANISADIRALTAAMVTKEDLRALSENLHSAIRAEVTEMKADITTHSGRIQVVGSSSQALTAQVEAANLAIARQGNMLLAIRRQTEDLDNRGHRSNIRVRGLPEPDGEENVEATLLALFQEILGAEAPMTIEFDQSTQGQ